jgi:hypothetical protein
MKDTRVIRQGLQALIGLAALCVVEITANPFDWRKLVAALIAGCGLLLTNPRLVPIVKEGMPEAGSSAAPPPVRDASKGHATPSVLMLISFSLLAVATGVSFTSSCHNVTPDQFFNATVDCAKVNPEASAALGQAETCLVSAVSGNLGACLNGLITAAHFTVDEVACVVAYIAQQAQTKVALGKYTADDLKERQAATNWLVAEKIQIHNSYPGQ